MHANTLQSRKILCRHVRLRVFLGLCSLALLILPLFPCRGTGAEPLISATANNEPLYHLLTKISKTTGYQIEITKGWKDKLVTAALKKVPLTEGMQFIIWSLGRPDYVMIVDDDSKIIEVRIFDTSSTGLKGAGNVDLVSGNAVHGIRIFPPDRDRSGSPADMDFNRQLPPRPDLGIEYPY